jgi:hypothetical protein
MAAKVFLNTNNLLNGILGFSLQGFKKIKRVNLAKGQTHFKQIIVTLLKQISADQRLAAGAVLAQL